jgi:hypothetical protein
MGRSGDRLSAVVVAVLVISAIVGLAFAAGYIVGRLLL